MNKTKELSPWEKTCMRRIKQLIDDYCDGSQQRFVEKTGLNKGSVSQYVNGKNIPSEANAQKIADAFNIDATWIMGYDVIPPGIEVSTEDHEQTADAIEWYHKFLSADPETRIVIQRLLKDS